MRLRLLSRYLLQECWPPFLFAIGALTGLMLLNQVARQFSDLVGKGLPWGVIGEVFGLSVPFIVAMTLPMAVLVAVLFAFSRLGADNEITALKASGVDLIALVRPVLLASVALAVVNFLFNDQVLPRSNHRLRTLLVDIARKRPTFKLEEQMVNAVIPGQFYLRAGRIDQGADRLREVVIYDLASTARRRTIYADSGFMRFNRDTTDLTLTLFDGYIHDYDQAQPGLFRRVFFHTDYVRMRGVSNRLERTGEDTFRGEREMSSCEMEAVVNDNRDGVAQLEREQTLARENDLRTLLGVTRRNADTASALARAARGGLTIAPYCRAVRAVGALFLPRAARADTVPRGGFPRRPRRGAVRGGAREPRPAAAAPAPEPVRRPTPSATDISGARLRDTQAVLRARRDATAITLSRYRVEIHKKFAIPAMCVVFVLIGAPLALRFPRGGVGLVIGASAGIFGLYYIGLIGGESLADKMIITPFWAMWGPNVLMSVAGLALFARLGREHATSRGGDWGERLAALRDRRRARREARP